MSSQTNLNQSVVFLDAGITDYQTLQAGVIPEVATVILTPNQDGIEQITAFLQQNTQITTIHLVSHGAPGCLYLGNCQLNLTNIYDYRQQLQNWANVHHILLYGCQVAAGDAGEEFIEKLHQLTGATVMASATPTGSSRGGGNWELEVIVSRAESEQDLNIYLAFDGETLAAYEKVFALSLVGNYDTPGNAYDVKVVGNYAYVADWTSGLQIIDVSTPTNPTLISNYDTSGFAMDVQIVGNYAYVADGYQGLQIIDISNPTNPTLKGNYSSWPLGWGYGLEVVGNYAYVASDYQGLTIIDISNPSNPTFKGRYDTSSRALKVQVIGNYAYVADYESGLQIIDVSNPTNPTLKGNYDTPGIASDVEVVGNYAYVADGWDGGLQIIDISNPTNPTLKGNYDTNGVAGDVEVVGNYAYLTDDMAGLKIIDISNPTNPTLIGYYDDYSTVAYGVEVVGNYAYVADYFDGLKIIDVSNFNNPSPLPSVTLAVSPTSVTEDGTNNLVYTFTRTGVTTQPLTVNFTTVNDTDWWKRASFNTDYSQTGAASFPNYPSETGTVTFAANSATATVTIDPTADTTVEYDETVALIITSGTGYTIGTPDAVTGTILNDDTRVTLQVSPSLVTEDGTTNLAYFFYRDGVTTNALTVNYTVGGTATFNTDYTQTGAASFNATTGTVTFAANANNATVTIDPTVDNIADPDETVTLTLASGTGYTVGTTTTVTGTINDDINPPIPTFISKYDTPGWVWDLKVVGNYAYLADWTSGLQIIDISNPTNPILKGNYDTDAAYGVEVVGNYAYVADGSSGLQIIDISNPSNPTFLGNYANFGAVLGVQVVGNYAYLVNNGASSLQIIDISNPTNPILKGSYDDDYDPAFGLQVVGNYAYVADGESGLKIIDISNPTNPILKGSYDTSYAFGVQIVGNYAYVADWDSGLQIIDISNPTNPILKGNYYSSGQAANVQVIGNYAYLAAQSGGWGGYGLQIIDISNPTNPTIKGNYKNFYSPLSYAYIVRDVQVVGNYAYAAGSNSPGAGGLQIIDVSDFNNPSPLPSVTLAVSTTSVNEDGTTNLVYTFTRTGSTTSALTANYTVGGTATFSTDYTQTGAASYTATTGTVTFAAGSSTATVTVDPTPDTTVENNETVALTLASGTGYTVGTTTPVTGTITNDDTSVTLAVSPASVTEDGTTNLIYTFTRTGVTTNPLTVNYTVGGTATNGTDYASIPTSVTFAANSATATVTVDPTADTTVEPDETVILTLASGTGYTVVTTTPVTGTITNDDTSVTLAVAPSSVTEDGTTNLVYTFTRTGVTTNALTVNYTLGGTATLNTDYTRTGTTNTVTFAANSATATVIVDPTPDTIVESNETVILTLATGTGYTVGTTTPVTGTITNSPVPPSITLAVSPSSVTEDGTTNLIYTFTRSGVTTNALTVNYTVGGTATNGTDYAYIPTSVTFAANSATATVTVDPTADTTVEPDETVILTLASGTGYTVGTPNAATGTITNDDLPSITLAVSPSSVTEDGTTNLVYTFTRSGVTTDALTVNYTVEGTATNGTDYASIPTSVTFAANSATATVTVDPTADTTVEPDETVILTLASGTGYTVGTTTPVTGTIINDD
ncbi:MAG: DUF4347 domain-containing protein, partial [Microcystis panniformis]